MLERIFWIFHKLSLLKSLIFSSLRAPSSSLLLIRRLGDNFRDIVLPLTVNHWQFNCMLGRDSTKYQYLTWSGIKFHDVHMWWKMQRQLTHSLLSPTIIKGSLALNARWLGTPSLEASSLCNIVIYYFHLIQNDEWPVCRWEHICWWRCRRRRRIPREWARRRWCWSAGTRTRQTPATATVQHQTVLNLFKETHLTSYRVIQHWLL